MASDFEVAGGPAAVAAAARAAPPGRVPPRTVDVLLDAFAIRLTDGYAAAAPALAQALTQLLAVDIANDDAGRWLSLSGARDANVIALEMWDDESCASPRLPARSRLPVTEARAACHLEFALQLPGQKPDARRRVDDGRPDNR